MLTSTALTVVTQCAVLDVASSPEAQITTDYAAVDLLKNKWGRDPLGWYAPYIRHYTSNDPMKWPKGILKALAKLAVVSHSTHTREEALLLITGSMLVRNHQHYQQYPRTAEYYQLQDIDWAISFINLIKLNTTSSRRETDSGDGDDQTDSDHESYALLFHGTCTTTKRTSSKLDTGMHIKSLGKNKKRSSKPRLTSKMPHQRSLKPSLKTKIYSTKQFLRGKKSASIPVKRSKASTTKSSIKNQHKQTKKLREELKRQRSELHGLTTLVRGLVPYIKRASDVPGMAKDNTHLTKTVNRMNTCNQNLIEHTEGLAHITDNLFEQRQGLSQMILGLVQVRRGMMQQNRVQVDLGLRQRVQSLVRENDGLRGKVDGYKQRCAAEKKQLNELFRQRSELRRELRDAKKEYKKLPDEYKNLRDFVNDEFSPYDAPREVEILHRSRV